MAILIGFFTGLLFFMVQFLTTYKAHNEAIPSLLLASTIIGCIAGLLAGLFS
jgi:lipid-A-disaccharide synthase-like uncharacterized protein